MKYEELRYNLIQNIKNYSLIKTKKEDAQLEDLPKHRRPYVATLQLVITQLNTKGDFVFIGNRMRNSGEILEGFTRIIFSLLPEGSKLKKQLLNALSVSEKMSPEQKIKCLEQARNCIKQARDFFNSYVYVGGKPGLQLAEQNVFFAIGDKNYWKEFEKAMVKLQSENWYGTLEEIYNNPTPEPESINKQEVQKPNSYWNYFSLPFFGSKPSTVSDPTAPGVNADSAVNADPTVHLVTP